MRAHGSNMKARQRRTCIQDGRAEVYTCEHLLAAMFALGDCEISTIDHMPGDGNSTRPTRRAPGSTPPSPVTPA